MTFIRRRSQALTLEDMAKMSATLRNAGISSILEGKVALPTVVANDFDALHEHGAVNVASDRTGDS